MLLNRLRTVSSLATSSSIVPHVPIKAAFPALLLGILAACAAPSTAPKVLSVQEPVAELRPAPITTTPWVMATASVTDIARTAQFFTEIGGYEAVASGDLDPSEIAAHGLPQGASGEALVLRAPGSVGGLVRLVRFDNAGAKAPMRPGSRAWDTGCFWSLMVRARNLDEIYSDAIRLGWWTQTSVTDLEFGGSVLKVVVFQGPDGLQIQAYERISPPLEGFTPFERLSQPFNIMQMTADREAARHLMEDVLGFDRFWFGPPYVEKTPTDMPLGIPRNLTTEIPYKAGIFYPSAGEYGRMEYIEIDGLEGRDFSSRCSAPNLGWLSVTYEVPDAAVASEIVAAGNWPIAIGIHKEERVGMGAITSFVIRSPDGAMIEFFEPTQSDIAGDVSGTGLEKVDPAT